MLYPDGSNKPQIRESSADASPCNTASPSRGTKPDARYRGHRDKVTRGARRSSNPVDHVRRMSIAQPLKPLNPNDAKPPVEIRSWLAKWGPVGPGAKRYYEKHRPGGPGLVCSISIGVSSLTGGGFAGLNACESHSREALPRFNFRVNGKNDEGQND